MFDFETEILEKLDREFEEEEVEEEDEGGVGGGHGEIGNGEASRGERGDGEAGHGETGQGEAGHGEEGGGGGHKAVEYVTKEVVDVHHSRINLPIPSSDERFPFKQHFFDRFNDIQINYGQVLPHINYATIDHRDIVDKLVQNRANPALIG